MFPHIIQKMQQKHFILASAKPKIGFLLTHLTKTSLDSYCVIHLANPQKGTRNYLSHKIFVSRLICENKVENGPKCTISPKDGRHFFEIDLVKFVFENFTRNNK